MRRFLLLFAAVFLSLAAFAAEEITKIQCLFGSAYNKQAISTYTGSFEATNDGYTWVVNCCNNNNNGWDYVKAGPGANIVSKTAIKESITQVGLVIDAFNTKVSKISLEISSNEDFTDKTTKDFTIATGEQFVTIDDPSANKYYKVVITCTAKKDVTISAINFYYSSAALLFDQESVELTYGDTFTAPTLKNGEEKTLTWDSSNKVVATVDGSGKVDIVGVGTTTISVTDDADNTNTASYELIVNAKPHGLAYETTSYVVNAGETFTTPTLTNRNGLTVKYSSNNTDVATVDANTGDVTLTGVFGTTAITATATNSAEKHCTEGSASYTIEVKDPNAIEHGLTTSVFSDGANAYETNRSYTTSDGIEYAARFFVSNGIQLNNKPEKYPGIVVTANPNGYILSKVTVTWSAGCTAGRELEIYGSNEKYTATSELDATNESADKTTPIGTKIGSLTSAKGTETELTITDPYSFIGIRALKAVIIDKITLEWVHDSGNTSSVESVVVDNEGAVEYFNLQGVRVQGTLAPGIYIRRSGNTTTKVRI